MITQVHFNGFVCVHVNLRQPSFYADEGWTITEAHPGRVLLVHPNHTQGLPLAVQGIGYSLIETRTQPPVEIVNDDEELPPTRPSVPVPREAVQMNGETVPVELPAPAKKQLELADVRSVAAHQESVRRGKKNR